MPSSPTSPRLAPVARADREARVAELLAALSGPAGELNIFSTLAHHPRLLKRWAAFGGVLLHGGELAPRDRELLILRTARNCGADYEWGHHVAIGATAGLSAEEIERVAQPSPVDGWPPAEAALLLAADQLHRDSVVSDDTWTALASRLTPPQLIEVCMVVGQYHLVAFALRSLGVQRESGVEGLPKSTAARR